MVKQRLLYWDTLKGFLIILVVLGHCGTAVGNNLLSSIYIFHMPLFILISGYFSKRADLRNWGGDKRLIIIYLAFHAAYLSLEAVGSSVTFHRLLIPSFALWYILSLIIWRLLLQYIPTGLLRHRNLLLAFSWLFSIAIGFVPVNNELAFQRTFVYWPFFLMGYYLKQEGTIGMIRGYNKWIASIAGIALLVLTYLYIPVMYNNTCYTNLPDEMVIRIIQLIVASILCLCFLIIGKERILFVTELGKYTLLIYLLHPPLVKAMKFACVKAGHTPNILTSVVITVVTIVCIYSCRNLKILKYLK